MSVNYNSVFLKRETDDIKNFIDSFYLITPSNTEVEFDKFIEYMNVQSNIINNLKILTLNEYFWRNINDILLNSINSWNFDNTWVFYKGCLMTFNNNVLEINEKTYDGKLKKDVIFLYEDGLYRRKYYLSSDINIYYFTSKSVNKDNDLNNLKNYGYYDESSNYKSKRIKLGEYYVVERNKEKINEELGNFINFFDSNQASSTGNNIDFVYRLMLNFIDEKKKQEISELKNYNYYVFGTSSITNKKGFHYPLSLKQYSNDKLVTFIEFPNINFYMPKSNINENRSELPNFNEFDLINYNERSNENQYSYIIYGTRNNIKGFYYPLSLVSFDNDYVYIFDEYPNIHFYLKEKEPSYNINLRPKNYNDYLDYKYIYIDNKKPKIFNNNLEEKFTLETINDEREIYLTQVVDINNSALLDPDAQISTINEVNDSVIINLDIEVDFETLLQDQLRTQILAILGQSMDTSEIVNILFYPGSIKIHILVNTDDVQNFENNLENVMTSGDFQLNIPNNKPDTIIVITGPDIKVDRNRVFISIISVVINDIGNPSILLSFRTDRITNNFEFSDINTENGILGNFFGSGKVYTAVFTPQLIGVCTIQVPANSFTDFAGEPNLGSEPFIYKFDEDPPIIVITTNDVSFNQYYNTTVSFTITINEDTFFNQSHITTVNGIITNFNTAINLVFTCDFTPITDGPCELIIEENEFTDYSANFNLETSFSWINDNLQPTINIIPKLPFYQTVIDNQSYNNIINFKCPISEELYNRFNQLPLINVGIDLFTVDDFVVTNGTINEFIITSDEVTFSFTPEVQGVCNIMIPGNKFTDKAGNFNTSSNVFQWTHDTTPAVTLITSIITDNGFYNSFMTINFSINKRIDPNFSFTISDIVVYRDDFTNSLPDGQDLLDNFLDGGVDAGGNYIFSVLFTPTLEGNYRIVIPVGAFKDLATNDCLESNFTWSYDITRPDITITSPTVSLNGYTNNNVDLVIDINEEINDLFFTIDDINCVAGRIIPGTLINQGVTAGVHRYIATFEPDGPGANILSSVNIDENKLSDFAGNNNTPSNIYSWIHDTTPPNITITAPVNVANGLNYYNGSNPILISLTVSEPLSNTNPINIGQIITTNGTVSNLQEINPTLFTIDFTIENQGDSAIQIDLNTIRDRAGNFNDTDFIYNFTYDTTQPTIQITSGNVINNGFFNTLVTLVFTVSEDIHPENTFVKDDISSSNCVLGTLFDLATNPPSFSIIATPTAEGTVAINVNENKFTDLSLNNNIPSNVYNWTHDSIQPDVTISTNTPNIISEGYGNQNVAFTFTVSELVDAVNIFDNTDITVTNGVMGVLTNVGPIYQGTFTPGGEGMCSINVPNNVFKDRAGNDNNPSNIISWIHDITFPTVTITVNTIGLINNGFYNNNAIFTITISEQIHSINTFEQDNITTVNGDIVDFTDNNEPIGPRTFTVEFEPDFEGTCSIIVNAIEFTDKVGNNNTISNLFSWTHDVSPPLAFTVGTVIPVGNLIVPGYLNILNTGIDITIPIATDNSLETGTIQLLSRIGTDVFTNLGTLQTITAGDITATSKTIRIQKVTLGGINNYGDGNTFNISAIITDISGNSTTGTQNPVNFVIDLTDPINVTLGNITTTGINNISNGNIRYYNSTTNGINITVPIDNDSTLVNGNVQLQAKYGANAFGNILAPQAINNNDITATTKVISINNTIIEGFLGYAENINILFKAIITDVAGNTKEGSNSVNSLTVKTTLPTVNTFSMNQLQLNSSHRAPPLPLVTLTFNKEILNFDSDTHVTVENGSLNTMTSVDNITWTGSFTPNNNLEDNTNELNLLATYSDQFGNPGVTSGPIFYSIDTILPTVQTVGNIATVGGTINTYLNSTNTGINIPIIIDNDNSLDGGTLQLQINFDGGAFTNIGTLTTLGNVDLATTKILQISSAVIPGIAGFGQGKDIKFRAIVTDSSGNSSTFNECNNSLAIDTVLPTNFTVGNITTIGGTIINGDLNNSNTGIRINLPIANDSSLVAGTAVFNAIIGGIKTNIGTHNIVTGDLDTTINFDVTKTVLATATNYAQGVTISFDAVIIDIAENETLGTTSVTTLIVDTVLPISLQVGNITIVGGVINQGFWNLTNTDLNVVVTIDNDNSLINGHVDIKAIVGTSEAIIGTFTILPVNINTNITFLIPGNNFETSAIYGNGNTVSFNTTITDIAGNSIDGVNSLTQITIDEGSPIVFQVGSVITTSTNANSIIAGFWNSNNNGVNVTVPLDNDTSLIGGTIFVQAKVGTNPFQNIGTQYTIQNGDIGGNKVININDTYADATVGIEELTGYADNQTISFTAVITDNAGNSRTGNTSATSLQVKTTTPTVTMSFNNNPITTNDILTIQFTHNVANFLAVDITMSVGSLGTFVSLTGGLYRVEFSPPTNNQTTGNTITLDTNGYTDIYGNPGPSGQVGFTYDIDNISPTITISSTNIVGGVASGFITVNLVLSESSINFTDTDLTLTNGTITNFTGTGTTYSATFTPTNLGNCSIEVPAGSFTDATGNNNIEGSLSWTNE